MRILVPEIYARVITYPYVVQMNNIMWGLVSPTKISSYDLFDLSIYFSFTVGDQFVIKPFEQLLLGLKILQIDFTIYQ